MAFAAIHIPEFAVQAAIRAEPALGGGAIALVDGTPPVWNVVAANAAALAAGIELGMPRALAEQFGGAGGAGGVKLRARCAAHEKAAHAALMDLCWAVSPRVEETAADTIVADLAGLSSLFGTDENIAAHLMRRISAIGLTPQIAVAGGIEAAVHAARGFREITLIAAGEEMARLGSLPVEVLGPAAETLETLRLWGVHTCTALAALPVEQLSERLGQEGVRLHEWARGAGTRAIVLAEPGTQFEEEMELDEAVEELEPLAFLLGRMLDQLCLRLTARSLAACNLRVRFALDPAGERDVQIRDDATRRKKDSIAYERELALPVAMRDAKLLLNLLRLRLQGDPPKLPILKIFLAADAARPRALQTGLFLPASPDAEKLEVTVARLANLVGEANVGSPRMMDTHRPDAFAMQRYEAVNGKEKTKGARQRTSGAKAPASLGRSMPELKLRPPKEETTSIGFRMFRPALEAGVQLRDGRPKSVVLRGTPGEVIAASGPWRTSGDWWREDGWHQDEWDLEVRFQIPAQMRERKTAAAPEHGLYRFYFDWAKKKWFVRGIYD